MNLKTLKMGMINLTEFGLTSFVKIAPKLEHLEL